MQSSFNVVKGNMIKNQGQAVIETRVNPVFIKKDETLEEIKIIGNNNNDFNAVGYSTALIEEAQKEALKIKNKAYSRAVDIERKAYEDGFSKGSNDGYQQGYEQGQNEALMYIQQKEVELLSQATYILKNAKDEGSRHLLQYEKEIKGIISETITSILKKSIFLDDVMDGILKEKLTELKKEEVISIYVNSHYYDHLNTVKGQWLEDMNSKADIKVSVTDDLELGKMIIEKSDGKINIDLTGLQSEIEDAVRVE